MRYRNTGARSGQGLLCESVQKYPRAYQAPRGRPRGFITDEVLERVRAVFMEKGFAGASLDELADAAGLNRPSLYAAFGDKEQLYIHTLRLYGARASRARRDLRRKGHDRESAGQGLQGRDRSLHRAAAPRGCMIVGTAAVEAPTHPKIAAAAAELLAAIEKSLERAFAASDLASGRRPPPGHAWPAPSCTPSPSAPASAPRPRSCARSPPPWCNRSAARPCRCALVCRQPSTAGCDMLARCSHRGHQE